MNVRVAAVKEYVTWQGVEFTIVRLTCGHCSYYSANPAMDRMVIFGTITRCACCEEREP